MIDYKAIVERLMKIVEREELVDEAYETYMKVKAPDSYCPIPEDSCTSSFLKGIECFNCELYDTLSRWIWETSRKGAITTVEGKEYVIDGPKSLITYLYKEKIGQ